MNEPSLPEVERKPPGRMGASLQLGAKLAALGVRPNHLTVAGFVATMLGGVLLALAAGDALPWSLGRHDRAVSWMPLWVALTLTSAAVLDTLDGAVARGGNLQTSFGAILDSTLDRFSDAAIFAGCAIHFAWRGNLTLLVLALAALTHAYSISYVKARAENLIPSCGVGFWQRPERCVSFLVAVLLGQAPAGLWLLGTLPALTVLSRIRFAHAVCRARDLSATPPERRVLARRSRSYLLISATVVVYLFWGPRFSSLLAGEADPLRILLQR